MNSICIELKTTCNSCGNPLPVNAFTNEITCPACSNVNKFDFNLWKNLLEDVTKDARTFAPDEGRNSQIMTGGSSFNIMYGNQNPRCSKCKTPIPLDDPEKLSLTPRYSCTNCGNIIFIRKGTDLKGMFYSFKYFFDEDESMINKSAQANQTTEQTEENKPKPILFTCPSCGGNLKIDGSERTITCSFCDSSIYLPDDLWHRMHPVKTVSRWYILMDDSALPMEWESLDDAVMDENGTIYYCGADSLDSRFTLAAFDTNLKKKWARYDYKIEEKSASLSYNAGKLLLWSKDNKLVYKLSVKDGSIIEMIPDKPKVENSFIMNGADSLTFCPDGTILAIKAGKISRFDINNNPLPLWSGKSSHDGFFSKLFSHSNDDVSPWINDLKDYPDEVDASDCIINSGWDGYIYLFNKYSDCYLAKYKNSGEKVYCIKLDFEQCDGKPCSDSTGNVYVLGKDKANTHKVVKVSPDGKDVKIIISGISPSKDYDNFEAITVSKSGEIYVYGDYSCFKAFDNSYKEVK